MASTLDSSSLCRWVQEQLGVLMRAIARLGHQDQDSWSVSFGTLFLAYQDISDAVGGVVSAGNTHACCTRWVWLSTKIGCVVKVGDVNVGVRLLNVDALSRNKTIRLEILCI